MKKIFKDMHLEDYVVGIADFKPFGGTASFPDADSGQGREIVEAAEEYLTMDIPTLTASLYMRFAKDGNRTEFEAVYFERHWRLLTLMTAECIEKKGRFLSKLMDYVWSVCEESTWIIPAHYHHTLNVEPCDRPNLPNRFDGSEGYIDLFSAETAAHLALVYYFLSDEIKAADGTILIERMLYEIEKRVIQPYLLYGHMSWMGLMNNRVNNWSTWITSNILLVAGITVADLDKRRRIVKKAALTLDNFICWYGEDGGCDEGPSYWDAAGGALYDSLEILHDMTGGKVSVFDESLMPIMEYICKVHICDRYYITCGDCPVKITHSGKRIYRMGKNFNSPELKSFGQNIGGQGWQLGHMPYKKVYDILTCFDKSEELSVFDFMYLPDLQQCAMRSEKAMDKGFYVWLKGGSNGENHNHNDVGSVGVYLDGRPLLVDIGTAIYTAAYFDRNLRYTLFATRSCDHNLPLIDGKGQLVGPEYSTDFFEADEITKTAKAGIKNAYENKEDIKELTREVSVKDGAVYIKDTAMLAHRMPIEYRFFCTERCEKAEDGVINLGDRAVMNYSQSVQLEIKELVFDDSAIIKNWETDRIYMLRLFADGAETLSVDFRIKKQ